MKSVLLIFCLLFSICCKTQTEKKAINPEKILIIYLSRTNNTKAVAEIIQQKAGGKLVAIEKEVPYPGNYQQIVKQVDRENEEAYLPPLKTKIENIEKFDIVFIGFPTWDMQMPPPMKSFLTENNLSGKTVIPFNTNAGYGVGRGFEQLRELCPGSEILKGFSVEGGYEKKGVFLAIKDEREEEVANQVDDWLNEIEIISLSAKTFNRN